MKINKPDNAAHILEKIIHISLSTCLIFLIFPRFTTLKDILLLTSVFCWVWLGLKHNGSFLSKDRTTISLSFFVIIAFISSVAGVEPLENLRRFKGEIIVPFLLFLIISSMYRDKVKALDLLRAPAVAFAMYTIYVLINYLLNYDVTTFLHKNIREMKIFDSYPQRSITLFPITVGIFLSMKNRSKYLLLTAAVLGFTIIAAYSSFTPLVSALSVLLLCAVFVQPEAYKIALRTSMAGIVVLIIILAMFKIETPSFQHNIERVNRLIHIDNEFKSAMGFSDRTVRWRATLDIIKERPLLGYGSGMKKFQNIVQWDKFMSKWKRDNPEIYDFYRPLKNQFYPPHNMFLEIAFQFGIIGLLSFLLFIYLYSYQLIKTTITLKDFNFSVILIGGTLLSFMIMGLMNNELGTTSGKFLFVVFGVGAGWMNNTKISG